VGSWGISERVSSSNTELITLGWFVNQWGRHCQWLGRYKDAMRRDFFFFWCKHWLLFLWEKRLVLTTNDHFCVFASLFWLGIITFLKKKKKNLTWRFYIRMIDYTHKYQKSSRHEAIRFKPKNHIVFSHLVLQSYQLHDYDYPRVLLASNCLMEHENICLAWALNLRKIAKNFDYYARDDAAMKIFKKKKSSI